ncbi:MAG: hypothetical protein Q8O99_01470 [bacterium]|nr:hypothetical protein [bacterium]
MLQEYLTHNTDDRKFDPIAYPTHIEKDYAYEAGYINSDGYDLISKQEDVLNQEPSVPTIPVFDPNKHDVGDKST